MSPELCSSPQSFHNLSQTSTAASWASLFTSAGTGLAMTPYDTAIAGIWSVCRDDCDDGPGSGTAITAASAAPIVPEDKANAVEELRPSANQ